MKAVLVLEDGRVFPGEGFGAEGVSTGEIVFNTSMTGYQEILTDPSYHRQIVTMTVPHVGNTGVNLEDPESGKVWVAGFVVRSLSPIVSNWRNRSGSWYVPERQWRRWRFLCGDARACAPYPRNWCDARRRSSWARFRRH